MKQFSFNSMGTVFEVVISDNISDKVFDELCASAVLMSKEFDQKHSRFIQTSFVSQISKKTGRIQVDKDFMKMLKMYVDLYELSEKKLNPLIGFSLSDLGYDAEYSFIEKEHVRPTPDLIETVTMMDESTIMIKEPVLFDFGALGKGYFVDKVVHFLQGKGMKDFLVNGSGDIFCQGKQAKIGLEDPGDEKKVIGVVEISNKAIACSGPNKRRWGFHNHIINPISLYHPQDIASIWVKAESTALADALATCLFFVDPKNIVKKIKFDYLILDTNYKVSYSPNFKAELFS